MSGGATSTRPRKPPTVAATCAAARQPMLCATTTVSGPRSDRSRSTDATQSHASGSSQDDGAKRRVTRPGTSSHRVCQCPGPELWMPGTVSRCMRTPGAGGTASVPTVESDAVIPPVVPPEWLAAHRGSVVLADVRWYLDGRSGRAAYEEGHLPGAVFVDLDRWLAGPSSPEAGRHPLPEPGVFAEGMAGGGRGGAGTGVAHDHARGGLAPPAGGVAGRAPPPAAPPD